MPGTPGILDTRVGGHPTEEILLGVASGDADLPRRVLVEGHLGGCPSCRSTLAEMTLPGAALLRAIAGEAPPPELWDGICRRLEAPSPARIGPVAAGSSPPALPPEVAASPEVAELPLPANVRRELPALAALRRVPWRWALAPGAWYAELARDPWSGSVLLLGYLAPGRWLPAHLHLAQEDVLVLAGGFDDEQGRHEAGEYAIYPAGSWHRPVTEPGEACWCLARLERANRLLGWRGWLQRLPRGDHGSSRSGSSRSSGGSGGSGGSGDSG
ncbi:MAG: cupin domain-containing protein [Acidobacteria bacterium]|nr:cupin domain-containing protein [Acidobacteriota bacterium]